MNEEAVSFGARKSLVGVVTTPSPPELQSPFGVLLLNAGLVHRTGPGRIYVKMARALAALGFTTLRFDFSGIGDSPARADTLSYEKSVIAETMEAIDHLALTRGVDQFVVIGGCSGAVASFETAACDPRVLGAVLINFQFPEDDNETSNERSTRNASHYYQHLALKDAQSWRRLLTGKSDYAQLLSVLRRAIARAFLRTTESPTSAFQTKLRELTNRGAKLAFVCSQKDPGLKQLREHCGKQLKRLSARGHVTIRVIPKADHTFTTHLDQEHLVEAVCKRLSVMAGTSEPLARELRLQSFLPERFSATVAGEEFPPR